MSRNLPTKLGKEPLVDVIFELRFSSKTPASSILPGVMFSALGDQSESVSVTRLPLSQVPEGIRRADPNLEFAPLVKLQWGRFAVYLSDSSVAVGCDLPYPGWTAFRKAIERVVSVLVGVGIVDKGIRYSLKYVDAIPCRDLHSQVSALDWAVRIGTHSLAGEVASLRIEIPKNEYLHIVSVQTGAVITLPTQEPIEGIVVDVDSICLLSDTPLHQLSSTVLERLDDLHAQNKLVFFECLTDETLHSLEPIYE